MATWATDRGASAQSAGWAESSGRTSPRCSTSTGRSSPPTPEQHQRCQRPQPSYQPPIRTPRFVPGPMDDQFTLGVGPTRDRPPGRVRQVRTFRGAPVAESSQGLKHVCGTIRPMAAGPAVSAPMLSAAPGVLLASELARLALGQEAPGSVTMTSILTGPHSRWTFLRQKTADCACSDELYRRHYRSKW